jgi:hypothetical protein
VVIAPAADPPAPVPIGLTATPPVPPLVVELPLPSLLVFAAQPTAAIAASTPRHKERFILKTILG